VPFSGFFALSRTDFVRCQPPEACAGALNAPCAPLYTGPRCATCAVGAYRKGLRCSKCPNTAWLLLLVSAVALCALVSASVYLTKKKVGGLCAHSTAQRVR
jgi:hypothetical protein